SVVLEYRTAEVDAILILLVWRGRSGRIRRGVQHIVADELVNCPMEVIRSRARDEIDVRSRTDRELRIRDVRLDVEFLNRVGRRTDSEGVRKEGVVQHSVHRVVVLLWSLSINRRADRTSSELYSKEPLLPTLDQRNCSGAKQSELIELPSIKWQFNNCRVIDHLRLSRRRSVDRGDVCVHLHCLRSSRDRHLEIQ